MREEVEEEDIPVESDCLTDVDDEVDVVDILEDRELLGRDD